MHDPSVPAPRPSTLRRRVPTLGALVALGALVTSSGAQLAPGGAAAAPLVPKWSPIELSFEGTWASEDGTAPNPFLDRRLQVTFVGPSGQVYDVPGFFAGDGAGGGTGNVWRVRFSADEAGTWSWSASFRKGTNVAIDLSPAAGSPTSFDGQSGTLLVGPIAPGARGFLADGRLEYVGEHYLRTREGRWFLKTGTNGPENLLAYGGFDDVSDVGGLDGGIVHAYGPHLGDWRNGDPPYQGLVGVLNYLESAGVNAVYFLPMNLGGDGQDTWPFVSPAKTAHAKTHYDVSRLAQWNEVFEHAQARGIQLQFVLSETEAQNEQWLDGGGFGVERKLYFRELVARFGHVLAIKWNLGEEADFSHTLLREMADYLAAVDPYDHPIAVHNHMDAMASLYTPLLGDTEFHATSIQYSLAPGPIVEEWREKSAGAGHRWVVDMDEPDWPGVTDDNAIEVRKEMLWDVLLSGGNVEWYLGIYPLPLGGDVNCEDLRTRHEMFTYSRIAREFLEENVRFWEMEPADGLLTGEAGAWGGGEVFAAHEESYVVYLPDASPSGTLALHGVEGSYELRWFDPRTGEFAGAPRLVRGDGPVALGSAPSQPNDDWVVLLRRVQLYGEPTAASASAGEGQSMLLDFGPANAFQVYQILASVHGTEPGTPFGAHVVPLNLDGWSLYTLLNPYGPAFTNFLGVTDAKGRATASFSLAPYATDPGIVGATVHHAGLLGLPVQAVSNPIALEVLP